MFAFSTILLAVSAITVPVEKPTTQQVRETIQRSIPYIEKEGDWWIEQKKCVSCHRGSTMVWSLGAAKRNGFEVSDRLEEWSSWVDESALTVNENGKIAGAANKEGVAQILLSYKSNSPDTNRAETRKNLTAILRDSQLPDGSWKPGGQLPGQKRDILETTSVSTMWLTLALLAEGANAENGKIIEQAMTHIKKSPPGKSTEWYVMKLLVAVETKDNKTRDQMNKDLNKQQAADGGWGWIVGENSDALGTGLALYALLQAGQDKQSSQVQRAQAFLVSTQLEDGSWSVLGTKEIKKDRVEKTAVFWGATWAVIALVDSLPEQAK
ncbi:MAG: terpene cyclase/mutase family protein [Planctomycetaceae bacterium]|nr:terpene cyclase/mutase family protein [Planctomycetaceae bacterium]